MSPAERPPRPLIRGIINAAEAQFCTVEAVEEVRAASVQFEGVGQVSLRNEPVAATAAEGVCNRPHLI